MRFNSLHFASFFLILFCLYWLLPHKRQNQFLLIASYYFYSCWDARFLLLILLSTVVDYYCGRCIDAQKDQLAKKKYLIFSIIANLGILGFFKYFNFFSANLMALLSSVGLTFSKRNLSIILPVGISFYTFQTMSYTIDIYRGKLKHVDNFFDFALYVAFFPQLVAGPIERAVNLVPQILTKREFSSGKVKEGFFLIFWGLFKKVFIADNVAKIVDRIFAAPGGYGPIELLLSLYAFAVQIYCDFSGYTDIARGVGKTLGFELCLNFNLPYFAGNPRDFWQRWHISLSSWLKDYLYLPLGGNRKGNLRTYINLMLVMLLGGLWHGAAWTFVAWGAYHGLLLIIHKLYRQLIPFKEISDGQGLHTRFLKWLKLFCFFQLVCLGWLLFRAESLGHVWLFLLSLGRNFYLTPYPATILKGFILYAGILLLIQIWQALAGTAFIFGRLPLWARSSCYAVLSYLFFFHAASSRAFIYFQF